MLDVIGLLERIGQDAQLSHATPEVIELALADAEIAPELQAAIVAGDQEGLRGLLGLVPICAMYAPAKEDEDKDSEEIPPGEEDDDSEHSLSHLQNSVG